MKTLKEERLTKKLSLRALASLVGVSRQAILAYEYGEYMPTLKTFKKIKEALNLSGDLFDYFDPNPKKLQNINYNPNAICKIENCDNPPKVKGFCRNHYHQAYIKAKRKKNLDFSAKRGRPKK